MTPEKEKYIERELNRKSLPPSVELELVALGRSLFEFLVGGLLERRFNARQSANAIVLLFGLAREQCYGSQGRVLDVALEFLEDERIEVRDAAAVVAVRTLLVGERFPSVGVRKMRPEVSVRVADALRRGLGKNAREYVEEFLRGEF